MHACRIEALFFEVHDPKGDPVGFILQAGLASRNPANHLESVPFVSGCFYSAWRGASEAGLKLTAAPSPCSTGTVKGEFTTGHCPLSTLSGAVPLKPR